MSLQDSHQIGDVKVMLKVGADGKGIKSIEKTGTAGIVDTYTITFTDETKTTFEITNGSSIESIEKTQTVGLVDTYTITLTNGETSTFTVTNGEGGGLLPHIIVISETGSVVTLTKGTDVITAVETSTGHFETDVPEYGTWVIDAIFEGEDAQVSLVVDACKVYVVDDTHFHADITVNYPSGSTCNLSGGSESYYATGSPYTFTVHHADTYTITVNYDGETYTDTVIVSDSGEDFTRFVPSPSDAPINDIDFWLMYGEVSGSYSSLSDILADSSALSALMASTEAVDYLVRCTDWATNEGLVPPMTSATTPSGEVTANNYYSSFYPWLAFDGEMSTKWDNYNNGSDIFPTWIGYEFPSPIVVRKIVGYNRADASNTSAPKTFKVQAYVNNEWADISDTITNSNTTQGGKFVDNAINPNEVASTKYRLYITEGFSSQEIYISEIQFYGRTDDGVCGNSDAMSYIGLNNYASNTLLADATWRESICNSEYFESVLNVKVPTMTSNTTPSGVASASSSYDANYVAWKAFNKSLDKYWSSANNAVTNQYLRYQFTDDVTIYRVDYKSCDNNGSNARPPKNVKLQSSTDGTTFTDITSWTCPNDANQHSQIVDNISSGVYWQLFMANAYNANYIYMNELQFYGREDV